MAVVGNGTYSLWNTHIQHTHHLIYNNKESREQAKGLESICPHQRLDTSATRIEPYQNHHPYHRNRERHIPGLKHKAVENHTHHVESRHSPRHLRQQEKRSSRFVSPRSQSLSQIGINSGKIQFII